MQTAESAIGKWRAILPMFGVDDAHLVNRHGPCPLCGGNDRFRFDDKDGRGTWFCNQCGSGDGFTMLERITGKDFSEVAKEVDNIVGTVKAVPQMPKSDPRKRLRAVASKLVKVRSDDPVDLYLRSRGIERRDDNIKLHPDLVYYDDGKPAGRYPAMVSLFRGADGSAITYHIVYLTPDGQKALVPSCKKILPPLDQMAGGAIRIGGDAKEIGICEGVETAMMLCQSAQLPVWAATSATLLESWQPPKDVSSVVVYGDNDKSFTGQRAAFVLAHRLALAGLSVKVHIPSREGNDWLDELT